VSERAEMLATQLRQVSDAVVRFIAVCSDEQWRMITQAEQWPVCVVCRHIARALEVQPQVFRRAASGQSLPSGYTWEDIHRSNAEQAREWAKISKEETLLPLRRYADEAVAFVSQLNDDQLDHTTKAPLDEATMSVEQMIEGMIEHARIHLGSIQATSKNL